MADMKPRDPLETMEDALDVFADTWAWAAEQPNATDEDKQRSEDAQAALETIGELKESRMALLPAPLHHFSHAFLRALDASGFLCGEIKTQLDCVLEGEDSDTYSDLCSDIQGEALQACHDWRLGEEAKQAVQGDEA